MREIGKRQMSMWKITNNIVSITIPSGRTNRKRKMEQADEVEEEEEEMEDEK